MVKRGSNLRSLSTDYQRDIHYDSAESRDGLVKRVQEAMDASDRRQDHELDQRAGNTVRTQIQEIELDDLTSSKGNVTSK